MSINWLHSGGINNTNTDLDLGGPSSAFSIVVNPLNNLFDDVVPYESTVGQIEYRCIYLYNFYTDLYLTSPRIDLISQVSDGSTIEIGIISTNDIQRITINGTPTSNGYLVLKTEFGPAFTASGSSLATLAADIQSSIRTFPYCSLCTATLTTPSLPYSPYIDIEFKGQVGRRNTELISLVKNKLVIRSGGHFLPAPYSFPSTFNTKGASIIRIKQPLPIDAESYLPAGPIHVYNPNTGLYEELEYFSINVTDSEFNLTAPLQFELGVAAPGETFNFQCYDEVYVPPLEGDYATISIKKVQEGSPVNTIADFTTNSTTEPAGVTFSSSSIFVGTIFCQEGMPLWIKRTTSPLISGLQNDGFSLELSTIALTP